MNFNRPRNSRHGDQNVNNMSEEEQLRIAMQNSVQIQNIHDVSSDEEDKKRGQLSAVVAMGRLEQIPFRLGEQFENGCISCTICLEDFEEDEPVTRMKCQHIYHKDCL